MCLRRAGTPQGTAALHPRPVAAGGPDAVFVALVAIGAVVETPPGLTSTFVEAPPATFIEVSPSIFTVIVAVVVTVDVVTNTVISSFGCMIVVVVVVGTYWVLAVWYVSVHCGSAVE